MEHKGRALVYVAGIIWAGIVYLAVSSASYIPELKATRLADWYGLTAFMFLYLTILPDALYGAVPELSGKPFYDQARKALGLTALAFALLHAALAFFLSLGGFAGLAYLPQHYIIVLGLGLAALCLMIGLALPTIHALKERLMRFQKIGSKFIYIIGVLILFHSVLLGSHFVNLGRLVPQIYFLIVFLLLFLESVRIRNWLVARRGNFGQIIWLILLVALLALYYFVAFSPKGFHVH